MSDGRSAPLGHDVRDALQRFTSEVRGLPSATFVFIVREGGLHVYVGLERRILRDCRKVYRAMDDTRIAFPRFRADFHLIYAGNQPVEEFTNGSGQATILWQAAEQHHDPAFVPGKIYRNVPRPIEAPVFGPAIRKPAPHHMRD